MQFTLDLEHQHIVAPDNKALNQRVLVKSPNGYDRYDTIFTGPSSIDHRRNSLWKMSHFGTAENSFTAIEDFVMSEVDMKTGEPVVHHAAVLGGFGTTKPVEFPDNYIDTDGLYQPKEVRHYSIYPLVVYDNKFRTHEAKLTSNKSMDISSTLIEDAFNVPFDMIAAIYAALTSVPANFYPIEALLKIDSDLGLSIEKIKFLPDVQFKEQSFYQMGIFFKLMDKLFVDFKHVCDVNDSPLRINAYIHPFGVSIHTFSKAYSKIRLLHHFNNSDHQRLIRNVQCYTLTKENEYTYDFMRSGIPSLVTTLTDPDEKESFLNSISGTYYTADYPEKPKEVGWL